MIAMIEGRKRAPRLELAQRLDDELGTPGTFVRLQQAARINPLPQWFRPYAEIEATATRLKSWQANVVDGLLQTEDYARALLSVRPNTNADELEELVAVRIERQAVLSRQVPPLLLVLLDETVLMRPVGSPKIMHDQLIYLEEMSHRPSITIGVVPLEAGAHTGLLGSFALAEADDAARAGYLETASTGMVVEAPASVTELAVAFDDLLSEALPRAQSRKLILKKAGEIDE